MATATLTHGATAPFVPTPAVRTAGPLSGLSGRLLLVFTGLVRQGFASLALVRPADADGLDHLGRPRVWLRISQDLERSLRRLREFSLDACHELRGPLAAMAANAEMGMLDGAEGDELQRRRFEAIASASFQMQSLVDDLLLVARGENRGLDQPQALDLGGLVKQQLEQELAADVIVLGQPVWAGVAVPSPWIPQPERCAAVRP